MGLFEDLFWKGTVNGIGPAPAPPFGGANPPSGFGAGGSLTAAHLRATYAAATQQATPAQQAALAGLVNVGVPGFALGQLIQAAAAQQMAAAQRPRTPLHAAGITVGEIVGWRIWQVRRQDRLLVSYSADRIWLPGEPMEGRPSDHGSEGVWAFKDPAPAATKLRELPQAALGTVWLWGDVVEHEVGYRAQFAALRSLEWAGPKMQMASCMPTACDVSPMLNIRQFGGRRGAVVAVMGCDDELLDQLIRRYRLGDPDRATPDNEKSASRE